jgi:hypothetical protein
MTENDPLVATIRDLARNLAPVRPLAPPPRRTLVWVAAVAILVIVLYALLGAADNADGFMSRPYVLPSLAGSLLTALLAALAAFEVSLPDRSARWALLPVPPLLLWIAASGLGCLAGLGGAGAWGATLPELRECLTIILATSVPASLLLIVMLRRALPLRPNLVALLGGLAAAAAAGSVLLILHPHNSTLLDLGVHALCVSAVITANAILGGRILARV